MRSFVLLQPHPQPAIVAVDLIAQHPRKRNPGRQGALDHALRQLRLGRKRDSVGHGGRDAALPIVSPVFGKIQFAVDQGMACRTAVGEKNADLTVLDPSCGPGILAPDAGRLGSFLETWPWKPRGHAVSSTISTPSGAPRCSIT
jgi:hypothetical protein